MGKTTPTAYTTLFNAIRTDAIRNPLAVLNEHHTKVVAATALLECGFVLLEGSPTKGLASRVTLVKGKLVQKLVPLPVRKKVLGRSGASPDLRIESPDLHIEFKTKPSLGAKAQRASVALSDDFRKLSKRYADLVVLVSELDMYKRLRYEEKDAVHGNALNSKELTALLPKSTEISDGVELLWRKLRGSTFWWAGGRFWTHFGNERVVLLWSNRRH